MNIILKNIQCIKEAYYNLPKSGVVQIKGDNSNGKSVLIKAISGIVNLKILDEDERSALINDKSESGSILIENEGVTLYTCLNRERSLCFVTLVRKSGEKITRTFRDGGIKELIHEFGFRCYDKNSVCLQLFETFGPMPFVNTSTAVNGEIVESITEDTTAKTFLQNFKEVTHPAARKLVKQYNEKIEQLERFKNTLVLYDYGEYENFDERMTELYEIIKYLKPVKLEKVEIVQRVTFIDVKPISISKVNLIPKVTVIDVKPLKLPKVPVVKIIPECPCFDNISHLLSEMSELRNGVCPTCGRPLLEGICE